MMRMQDIETEEETASVSTITIDSELVTAAEVAMAEMAETVDVDKAETVKQVQEAVVVK
jgi:hypothetical protein